MSEPTAQPTPAPAAAPATPPPAEQKPTSSPLLSNILGLVAPDKVDVKPVAKPEPEKPEKPAEPSPAATPEPAATPPVPAPEKRVPVRRKEAAPPRPSAEEVRRIAAEEAAKAVPTPAATPVVPTPAAPDDTDLTPEQREELELAALAEGKDPTKKGLADKFRRYYADEKKFLEKRHAEVGDDYDPTQDPEYKKFTSKNEPRLTTSERKQIREEKIAAEAAARATRAAEEKLVPEIERLRTKTLEIEHRPKIHARVTKFVDEVAGDMPDDVVKFYNENGRSVEKTREAFPEEFAVIEQTIAGARALADEALAIRRGLVKFDPVTNGRHQFLHSFVDRQAKAVLADRTGLNVRDGKTFVHPYDFKPGMEAKHWTFDDEDILGALRSEAASEAKSRIDAERKRIRRAIEAEKRRAPAPAGANTPPPTPPAPTRTPPAPAPGAATPTPKTSGALSRALGLG